MPPPPRAPRRCLGLPLTPGGRQIGYMDHTGCHQLVLGCHHMVFLTIRPTGVVTPGSCQIGYMDHTGGASSIGVLAAILHGEKWWCPTLLVSPAHAPDRPVA
jgi:hypothetical protein